MTTHSPRANAEDETRSCRKKNREPVDEKARGIWKNPLIEKLLLPISAFYAVGSYFRLKAYEIGILERKKAKVPVISVGNITVGGTGKTPVTIDLAKTLLAKGRRPAILSRGYRRKSDKAHTVVSDGSGAVLASQEEAGDEPFMMAETVPNAVIISGSKRRVSADIAVDDYGCDCIVLDDGFQHLPLIRDVDVVLIDYYDNLHNEALLPAGRLREPLSALARASHIVITKVPLDPDQNRIERIEKMVRKYNPNCNFYACRFLSGNYKTTSGESTDKPKGKKALAICGIARPEQFHRTVSEAGFEVEEFFDFPDHHDYSTADVDRIISRAESSGVKVILTTDKDMVKLRRLERLTPYLVSLSLEVQWLSTPLVDDLDMLRDCG